MKIDIEWLIQMIKDERETLRKRFESGKGTPHETTFNEGRDWTLAHVLKMIYNLGEPEVLPQELPMIPIYVAKYLDWFKCDFEHNLEDDVDFIVSLVQIPHEFLGREELESWLNISGNAHKLIDAYRWGYGIEKVPSYHALVKGHELLTREYAFKYWSYDAFDDVVFTSELPFQKGRLFTVMSKEGWNKLGINDSNAEFVKVDE